MTESGVGKVEGTRLREREREEEGKTESGGGEDGKGEVKECSHG